MTDAEILTLFQQRDEQAVSGTAEKYGVLCRSVGMQILGSAEDTEECFNDVLMQLWTHIPPEQPESLPAYCAVLMRNCCLKRYRDSRAEKRGGGQTAAALEELSGCIRAAEDTERSFDQIILREAMNRFLDGLPEDARNIFVRRYFYLSPEKEIAALFGMSLSKVKVTLHRTRKKLRQFLEEEGLP